MPANHTIKTEHKDRTPGKKESRTKTMKATFEKGSHHKNMTFSFQDLPATTTSGKIALIKNGLSKANLDNIKTEAELDYGTLSTILSVSRAKLLSKKSHEKFDPATSERILLLADVIAYGKTVFEDDERFRAWLRKSSKALGGATPLQYMDTIYGMGEVKKELGRIEYGIF